MSKKPKVITMIPVRMASSRLPNKPLLDINGKTLIQRVYEHVKNNVPGDVVIAAGDQVIVDEAKKFGAKAVLTDPKLPSGTDRIAAALQKIDLCFWFYFTKILYIYQWDKTVISCISVLIPVLRQ